MCERAPHYKRLLQLLFNEKQHPSRNYHATVMPQITLLLFIPEYSEGGSFTSFLESCLTLLSLKIT